MPSQYENLSQPDNAAAVTPNDSTDLSSAGFLYVGTGGDVALITSGSNTVTFANVPSGSFLPVLTTRVLATGTTASDILVLN